MLTDELKYKLMEALEKNPELSQREISKVIGISLGKVNFCINALMEVGLVKASNFKNSRNKLAYAYILTPKGIQEKAEVTSRFLQSKIRERDQLTLEIKKLKRQLNPENKGNEQ